MAVLGFVDFGKVAYSLSAISAFRLSGIIYGITLWSELMPKTPSELPAGVRATDTLTVTQFATIFPIASINDTLERYGRGTVRVRILPNEYVIYFVMMLALFRDCSHREVYRCVVTALNGW
jgi:hypothetical protein